MPISVLDRRARPLKSIGVGEIAITVTGDLRVFTRLYLPPVYHSNNLSNITDLKLQQSKQSKQGEETKTLIVELSDFSNQYLDSLDLELRVRLLEAGEAIEISR